MQCMGRYVRFLWMAWRPRGPVVALYLLTCLLAMVSFDGTSTINITEQFFFWFCWEKKERIERQNLKSSVQTRTATINQQKERVRRRLNRLRDWIALFLTLIAHRELFSVFECADTRRCLSQLEPNRVPEKNRYSRAFAIATSRYIVHW